jgi:hypothetical protein
MAGIKAIQRQIPTFPEPGNASSALTASRISHLRDFEPNEQYPTTFFCQTKHGLTRSAALLKIRLYASPHHSRSADDDAARHSFYHW